MNHLVLVANNSSYFHYVEHESCANDINELKWHCAYQGRVETRLRNKVDQAG